MLAVDTRGAPLNELVLAVLLILLLTDKSSGESCNKKSIADNPKISPIYAVREVLGFRFRLAQEVAGRER